MDIANLRKRFLPNHLSIIFIAEAIPDSDDRFFYNFNTTSHDWLFLGLIRALYPDINKEVKYLREHKKEILERFMNDGYYLVDAVDKYLPKSTSSLERIKMIANNSKNKIDEVKILISERGDKTTKVILIKSTVFKGLHEQMINAGMPIVNNQMIPFPSNGQQKRFHKILLDTL